MKAAINPSVATATILVLAACSTPEQGIARSEYMLTRSGFTVIPAGSAEQLAEMDRLPANKLVARLAADGQTQYIYNDPIHCNCLYVGNQRNYRAFIQSVTAAASGLV